MSEHAGVYMGELSDTYSDVWFEMLQGRSGYILHDAAWLSVLA